MVADQRHYLAPLPEPQETERRTVLSLVAKRLPSSAVTSGVEKELAGLTELELKATGSWALVPSAQSEWITTAIQFLESCAAGLPASERPDPYWSEDVVAGIVRVGACGCRSRRAACPDRGAVRRGKRVVQEEEQ